MTDQEKIQYINYMQIKDELDHVAFKGIRLKLDGEYTDSPEIAARCVFQEENDYMRDYQRDGTGRIAELNFDKVKRIGY